MGCARAKNLLQICAKIVAYNFGPRQGPVERPYKKYVLPGRLKTGIIDLSSKGKLANALESGCCCHRRDYPSWVGWLLCYHYISFNCEVLNV